MIEGMRMGSPLSLFGFAYSRFIGLTVEATCGWLGVERTLGTVWRDQRT